MQDLFNDWLAMLDQFPVLFYLFISLISLAVGSFLNVVIYRYPLMIKRQWKSECCELLMLDDIQAAQIRSKERSLPRIFNLMWPLSHCPHCAQRICARDNIPLLSYLFLRGRCRHCQAKISGRYFAVEALTWLSSLLIAMQFGVSLQTVCALAMTWMLIAISLIDYDELFIPDEMSYILLWAALWLSLISDWLIPEAVITGALVGYLSLWTIAKLFKLIMRKDGMGHGDFKLTAALGAWLGWQSLPFVIFVGSVSGLIIGILLILFKDHERGKPIPFGPFLAIGGWLALLLGDKAHWMQLLPS